MKGYTKVPNDFIKWLYDKDLTGLEFRIVLFVFRKTVGWRKELDKISLTQFEKELKVTRRGITKAIKRLVDSDTLIKISGGINSYKVGNTSTLDLGNKKVQGRESPFPSSQVQGREPQYTNKRNKETIQKDMKNIILKEKKRMGLV